MINKKFKILLVIIVIFAIIYIYYKIIGKKTIIQTVPISEEVLEQGILTDIELKNQATQLHNQITGVTVYEEEYLQSLLNISDIDLVRLYNIYLDLFDVSLYQDLVNEWYWGFNDALFQSVKQRFINLHIAV